MQLANPLSQTDIRAERTNGSTNLVVRFPTSIALTFLGAAALFSGSLYLSNHDMRKVVARQDEVLEQVEQQIHELQIVVARIPTKIPPPEVERRLAVLEAFMWEHRKNKP